MIRRGNCYGRVAGGIFRLLKRDRSRRKIGFARDDKYRDAFNCIETSHNPKGRQSYADNVSPVEFGKQYFSRLQSAQDSRDDSQFRGLCTLRTAAR
jgi:hypothetical protein